MVSGLGLSKPRCWRRPASTAGHTNARPGTADGGWRPDAAAYPARTLLVAVEASPATLRRQPRSSFNQFLPCLLTSLMVRFRRSWAEGLGLASERARTL